MHWKFAWKRDLSGTCYHSVVKKNHFWMLGRIGESLLKQLIIAVSLISIIRTLHLVGKYVCFSEILYERINDSWTRINTEIRFLLHFSLIIEYGQVRDIEFHCFSIFGQQCGQRWIYETPFMATPYFSSTRYFERLNRNRICRIVFLHHVAIQVFPKKEKEACFEKNDWLVGTYLSTYS